MHAFRALVDSFPQRGEGELGDIEDDIRTQTEIVEFHLADCKLLNEEIEYASSVRAEPFGEATLAVLENQELRLIRVLTIVLRRLLGLVLQRDALLAVQQ